MKACILAAGRGQRLDPLTETRPKPIINVGGKPLLQHTIEMLRDNEITEILLIVGYLKDKIKDKFGDGSKYGVNLQYTEQKEFLGTGHAANLAKDFTGNDKLMLIYGDLLMDGEVFSRILKTLKNPKVHGAIAAMNVQDPTKYGILDVDENLYLKGIVEKPPDDRFGNFANAGVYMFSPTIFDSISQTQKSPRGEYELTDSIEISIKNNESFKVVEISDLFWSDVGHPWQLLDANLYLLEKLSKKTIPNIAKNCEESVVLKGYVSIGEDSIIKSGTYIEGPVIIGKNCEIGPNSYIRPYSFIGNNCKIGNSSEVKNTIIMDNSAVPHLSYVGDSIIGENVNLGCGTVFANVRLDKKEVFMNIKGTSVNTYHKKFGAVVGDNVSFGINVCVMPGKKIGSNSQIGSNTTVIEDVKPNTLYYSENKNISRTLN